LPTGQPFEVLFKSKRHRADVGFFA